MIKKKHYYLYTSNKISNDIEKEYDCNLRYNTEDLSYSTPWFNYDFNDSLRFEFTDLSGEYLIIIKNLNTGQEYYKNTIQPEENVIYHYSKRYLIPYELVVIKVEHNIPSYPPIANIKFDLTNKDVLLMVGSETPSGLGDTLSMLQCLSKFHEENPTTNLYVCLSYPDIEELLLYSDYKDYINVIKFEDIKDRQFYATYVFGCFFDDNKASHTKISYKKASLVENAADVLDIYIPRNSPSLLTFNFDREKPKKHYVCIGVHASGVNKEWITRNNGWNKVVNFLIRNGYDVYDIDRERTSTNPFIKTNIPESAIDMTGDISLVERAKFLSKADFYIGCSSGLSWLAWCCQVPVVLISGFTNPITEFYTPYRIINWNECNSCWNDDRIDWDMSKTFCPREKNMCSDGFLICSTSITHRMVISTIKKIPEFIEYTKNRGLDE